MRLLVTGGCGLIGSAFVERAVRAGCHVTVLDNLSTGLPENLPDDPCVDLEVGEVWEDDLVGHLVRETDRVVHLAAGVGVPVVLERPTYMLRQSLLGSEVVLRHAAAARKPIFFASTSEVYGDSDGTPLQEDAPVGYGSPVRTRFSYAAGKAAGEALAFSYAAEYGLPVAVGRFFNVTGARQLPEAGVLARLVHQAQAGEALTVHGDGEQTRSFLDAADAAEYVWRLIARPHETLVNIGRDQPVTMRALAECVRDAIDPGLEIVFREPEYGSGFAPIRHRRPDCGRLLELTRHQPRFDLDAIVARMLQSSPRNQSR
ncbi:MAG: NAD-dependent epimerase/dehydratase family protein [Planctomycetota bacterium]|jgi:UDP-glucose 4-epimerase